MKPSGYNEFRQRGRQEFPIEYHHVDKNHPSFCMPYHWHIECELIYMLQGGMSLNLNEKEIQAKAGDVIFVRDGIVHGGNPPGSDCVYECLVFDMARLLQSNRLCTEEIAAIMEHELHINSLLTPESTSVNTIVSHLFAAMRTPLAGRELVAASLLCAFFGEVISHRLYSKTNPHTLELKRQNIRQIKKTLQLIDTSYGSPLTLQDLADAAGLSPNYFCKFFQKITHKSPIDYLNYYRIEVACEKLATSDDSCTEIAYSCGFNDLSYFTKLFKRYKGISPRKFRTQANKATPI